MHCMELFPRFCVSVLHEFLWEQDPQLPLIFPEGHKLKANFLVSLVFEIFKIA